MHKMPRIWTQYLELLVQRRKVTRARRTFDRALQALPITQHDRVWVLYLVRPWLNSAAGFWCSLYWCHMSANTCCPLGSSHEHHHEEMLCQAQKFVMRSGIPVETATRVYRRYLKLEPTHVEEYIAYLKKQVGFCWPALHEVNWSNIAGSCTDQPPPS